MGSSYYGEPNYPGNERSAAAGGGGGGGGGGSSSRKGNNKKGGSNNNSEKAPKQPQRGLGVAQLEKIRLNSQLIPSPTPSNYQLPTHYPPHLLNQEEIRMPTAASFPYAPAASSYGFPGHQNVAMGLGQLERANVGYPEFQPTNTLPRFQSQYPNSGTLETPYFPQPNMTRPYTVEDSFQKKRKKDSIGSSSQNSNTSDSELDLELKL